MQARRQPKSTRRRLFAVAVGAISYSGPILINVRQRTFVCQHLAEVAVLNPRAAQLAPIAVHRAFARIVGHRSRFNFRFPQCLSSLRDVSNSRSTWRFNALMTPMRANIGGPSCSATSNSASIAACHSSVSCSAFGSLVMYCAASRSVTNGCFRPGNMIGSKNRWSQDTNSPHYANRLGRPDLREGQVRTD
jgi:hypothetical protein